MSGARQPAPPLRYRALVRLLAPLLLAHLLVRARRDGGRRYVLERLGFGGGAGAPERPWVHAASVGEVLTVLPLLEAMLARPATDAVLVTTNTPTGAEVLARRAPAGVRHRYLPIDWPGATRRFLERERPSSARIVETELWPWLYAGCKARGIPLAIVNARLSPRTLRHADGPLGTVYRQALEGVDVLARSAADARGYLALGAETERVRLVGDLKLAGGAAAAGPIPVRLLERPYVLAASTHANEERSLAEAWLRSRPDGLLVIAPRHPERGTALARELPECRRRSLGEEPSSRARLHLADTLGELDAWYAHAAGVFVGGSLVERGGHNVLEPARHARPIVVGPHTANFAEAITALDAAAAIGRAPDAESVARFLSRALDGDDALARQGERAREVSVDTDDVVARYLAALEGDGTPGDRDSVA